MKNTIKQHTGQSLGKYLGKQVISKTYRHKGELISINLGDSESNSYCEISGFEAKYYPSNIYPILKDYTKLIEPMMWQGKEIIPIKHAYLQLYYTIKKECWESIRISDPGIWSIEGCLVAPDFHMLTTMGSYTPELIEKLIELGFGAIKSKKSTTGFVDLFGYPCVNYDEVMK